ncbi:Helitron helicase [Phytophthora megakarya]|uniref:Helitron helicase n=1 Tax=Phytophthora megakarya TaxID=4795 RepID=A0A225VMK6_9STRA|nr:Helitron helicase [Phytophthora megakarya]
MKNESEPSGGNVIVFIEDHRQIVPVLKDTTHSETKTACFKSRYPVNDNIGEGDIYLPHDPPEVPPVLGELRDEDAKTDRF